MKTRTLLGFLLWPPLGVLLWLNEKPKLPPKDE